MVLFIKKIYRFFVVKYIQIAYNNKFFLRKDSTDWRVFKSIFIVKEFQLPIDFDAKFIVDAGAYTGFSSVYFARKYPNSKVIAIEPESENFELLKKNTSKIASIKPLNLGIWFKQAYLKIKEGGSGSWSFTTEEVSSTDDYDVKAIDLNSILKENNAETIDILKLDIETSEKELFENIDTKLLDKINVIIIELHDYIKPGCSDAFYNATSGQKWKEFKEGEKVILIKEHLFENAKK